jgi:CubicO group peptidase (beta-lactamase class C family)
MNWVQTRDTLLKWSVEDRMKSYRINGLSIAVINNYQVEWAKGYGWADVSEKRKVTPQTLFQAASISKSLNATAVLKMVQDKKLDLNTDINEYLASWEFPYDSVTGKKKITLNNLLTHTAGLNIHGFPGYTNHEALPALLQVLDGKSPSNTPAVKSEFEPGLRFQYSGAGTIISQLIVEDVSGEKYEDFMVKNVLRPIGMDQSFFNQPPTKGKERFLATGYRKDGSELKGKYNIYPEQAAAGLWTNPTDLCKYMIETQLSYQGKSAKVLSSEMTKLQMDPYPGTNSALGTFIEISRNERYFQHSGANAGFVCQYFGSLDNGNGVAIMVNGENASIMQEVMNSVATVYGWRNFYRPVFRKIVEVPVETLSSYTGEYIFGGERFAISIKDSRLFLVKNLSWQMYFTSDTDFFVSEYRGSFSFLKNGEGRVTGFSMNDMIGRKIE